MKKILAVILTAVLIASILPLTFSASASDAVFVEADGVTYQVSEGETITYVYVLNTGGRISALDGTTIFDDGLLMVSFESIEDAFPIIGDNVIVKDSVPGQLKYNYSLPKGANFNTDSSELIRAKFKVTASSGTLKIRTELKTLSYGATTYINNGEIVNAPQKMEGFLSGKAPYDPEHPTQATTPTQPATDVTEKPTEKPTDPIHPNTDPSAIVYIKADGRTYTAYQGQMFSYDYYLNIGENLCSVQGDLFYDAEGLELMIEDDVDEIFPVIYNSVVANGVQPGQVKYNYSHSKGKPFNTSGAKLVQAHFIVIGEAGKTYEINNILHVVAGPSEHKFIQADSVIEQPLKNESFAPELTPYDWTPDPTEPSTAPSEQPTSPASEPQTEPGVDPGPARVFVKADGVTYRVRQGEIFDYIYYICTGDYLCAVDAELNFDTAGLEMVSDAEDYDTLFPFMGDQTVVNSNNPGRLKFNFSRAKGKKCVAPVELVHVQFRVTAETGEYSIDLTLNTVAASTHDEGLYMKNGVVYKPLQTAESELPDKTPYDPENPEPDFLLDEATGVRVYADSSLTLTVTEIASKDFNYYLYHPQNVKRYRIELTKNTEPYQLSYPVAVEIPAPGTEMLYTVSHPTLNDLSVKEIEAERRGSYLRYMTEDPGVVIVSADGTAPTAAMYGDTQRDDDLTIVDVSYIQRYLADITPFDDDLIAIADVDGDEDVSIIDGTHIQRYLADLPNEVDRLGYPKA